MTLPDLESFVWPDLGIEPLNEEDAIYIAGEQPIAGYDNHVMWAVTNDIESMHGYLGSHGHAHEVGGSQEINLDGLSIGSEGALLAGTDTVSLGDNTGQPVLTHDNTNDGFSHIAEIRDDLAVRHTLEIRQSIKNYVGDTLYDHTTDRFHRAAQADHADEADLAADSVLLDGLPGSAYLRPDVDTTVTAKYGFDQTVDASISGHAASASFAYVAEMAEDAELLEGWTVQEILDAAWQDVSDELVDIEDSGTAVTENARRLDFDTSIDVTAVPDGARLDVHSVPHAEQADHADEADWAALAGDSNQLEEHSLQEVLDAAWHEDELVDVSDTGSSAFIENARQIDAGTSIDVTANGTTARLDVESVPHSDQSDHAGDTDLHEGYTVSEIVNMSEGADGEWTYITEHTQPAGTSWSFNINLAPEDVYEQYKLIVINEHVGSKGYSPIWTRLNGDSRSRYNFMKLHPLYGSSTNDGWRFVEERRNRFWVCSTEAGYAKTAEYFINCPQLIDGGANSYPTFGEVASGGRGLGAQGGHPMYGRLETNYNQVDQFTFWCDTYPSAFYVKILGRNIR